MRRIHKQKMFKAIFRIIFVIGCATILTVGSITFFKKQNTIPVQASATPTPSVLVLGGNSQSSLSYNTIQVEREEIYRGQLIVVNLDTPYKSDPSLKLSSIYDKKNASYQVKDKNVMLSTGIFPSLNQMLSDFRRATGFEDLIVISGHRTLEYQKMLYQNKINRDGIREAQQWVAQPGKSEHHTGYTLDVGIYAGGKSYEFQGTGKCSWLNENCGKYGFIVRYPPEKSNITGISYEPWHFRYVGVPHAEYIMENNLCLEEYMEELKKHSYDQEHLFLTTQAGEEYEVYYVPAEAGASSISLPVPVHQEYTVSGNNSDGLIVTVHL